MMSPEEILGRPLDPLTYYRLLPTDRLQIAPLPALEQPDVLADRFLTRPAVELDNGTIDQLLLSILSNPESWSVESLQSVALSASLGYAQLLALGKSRRDHRMRLQHINYCCRSVLDMAMETETPVATAKVGDGSPPWDWLPLQNANELFILSGSSGLHLEKDGKTVRYEVGMASQLDLMQEGSISVGSIFSAGAYLFRDGKLVHIPHVRPIVLVFSFGGQDLALDYAGNIIDRASGAHVGQVDAGQVDRVRMSGSRLLISDWARPFTLLEYDLQTRNSREVHIPEIILLNDIVTVGECHYAICKQQGSVFKLANDYSVTSRRLSFGKLPHQLFDPISIRFHAGQIHIVSWVTGAIARIAPF